MYALTAVTVRWSYDDGPRMALERLLTNFHRFRWGIHRAEYSEA